MKNVFTKVLLVILCVVMVLSLVACDNGPNEDVELDDDGNIIFKPDQGVTKVTFWANCDGVEKQVFDNIVKQFNAQYKGQIEVKMVPKSGSNYETLLTTSLAGSNPPDVFYVGDSGYKAYAEEGYLLNISDFISTSSVYKLDTMWSNVTERYKYDTVTGLTNTESGSYYGVPKDLGPTVIYYNETYFKGAGIKIISVDEDGLAAFNAGGKDDRGQTKADVGIPSSVEVKEKGFFNIDGQWYFNNQIPMSWDETNTCAAMVQAYMRKGKDEGGAGKSNGYGYFTEWWFNYGWSVGGDCIQAIPTDNEDYRGYYYDFTLMDNTPNYIVVDSYEGSIKIGSNSYKAGEIVEYTDKVDLSAYGSTPDVSTLVANKGNYSITSEVLALVNEGVLNVLPSQREAFTEFVRIAAKTSTLVDEVDGEKLYGYGITPYPSDIGGDSGKTNHFVSGQLGMLVDGRWNVTNFRNKMDGLFEWDVAPLPMYKEYDADGNVTVHGVEAGHSGSVALCISSKSKVSAAAWKFIEFCGSEAGQTLQANEGFAIPLQKDLANSEVFLQSTQNPRNSKIFLDATEYETAGDWWYLRDNQWIDDWANVLNGSVRNGTVTMTQFYNSNEYNNTYNLLIKYAKKQ